MGRIGSLSPPFLFYKGISLSPPLLIVSTGSSFRIHMIIWVSVGFTHPVRYLPFLVNSIFTYK